MDRPPGLKEKIISALQEIDWKTDVDYSDSAPDNLAEFVIRQSDCTIEIKELSNSSPLQILILTAIALITDLSSFTKEIKVILMFLIGRLGELSLYDQGRFWHLKGHVAWRVDEGLFAAIQAFNTSLRLLKESKHPAAEGYIARVYDSFGQLLQYQGLLQEAKMYYGRSLLYRQLIEDDVGLGITLGNLGRLCLQLAEYEQAKEFFLQDLKILERTSPQQTKLRSQILSHLGFCACQLKDYKEAKEFYNKSISLAEVDQNDFGLAFGFLGLGQVALAEKDLEQVENSLKTMFQYLASATAPESVKDAIRGLAYQLSGNLAMVREDMTKAVEEFLQARKYLGGVGNLIPPVERARLLCDFARARIAQEDHRAAALLYREALQCLEATAADELREQIENELERTFRDSWLLHTAGRFVGHKMIDFLLRESGRSGFRGETKNLVVLFSDIRGFTTISERLKNPEDIITFFNDYLSRMTRCVEYFGGMIDKFIGDAVMALFSLPEPQPDDPVRAVLAALAMVTELERFNNNLPEDTPKILVGIGLHAGNVVAGLIGSPQKRSYTVIGDPVNTASRLESMTKQLGATILVSQEIYKKLPDKFLIRPLGKYRPMGKTEIIVVAEVMGEDDGNPHLASIKQEISKMQTALTAFENRDFSYAVTCFEALAQAAGLEEFRAKGYQLLAAKARELEQVPPPPDWKGEITLESK